MKLIATTFIALLSASAGLASTLNPLYLNRRAVPSTLDLSLQGRDIRQIMPRHPEDALQVAKILLLRRGAPSLPVGKGKDTRGPASQAQLDSYKNKGGRSSDSTWVPKVTGDVSKNTLKCTNTHTCSGEIVA